MLAVLDRLADQRRLHVGRNGEVQDVNAPIGEQIADGGMAARNSVCLSDLLGTGGIACRDRDRVEARLAVGDEVAIAHDEAGPDAADPEIPTAG